MGGSVFIMIKPSEKTKKKIAKRLERFGIKYSKIGSEWMYVEPVRICIPTGFGTRFVVRTEYPITPMSDTTHYSHVMGGRVSRLAREARLTTLIDQSKASRRILKAKAMDAAGELSEFLEHIRNPRVQVV